MARHKTKNDNKGVSLAKGPAGIVGLILLAFGVTALLFSSHSFAAHAISGTVNGRMWLGFEVNGWSSLLCAGAGAALLLAAPLHWGAKTISLLAGLVLGVAALLAFVDGHDALGIFAANGLTELGWAIAAGVLLVVALLPRVGRGRDRHREAAERPRDRRDRLVGERIQPTRPSATAGRVNEDRHDPIDDELARSGARPGPGGCAEGPCDRFRLRPEQGRRRGDASCEREHAETWAFVFIAGTSRRRGVRMPEPSRRGIDPPQRGDHGAAAAERDRAATDRDTAATERDAAASRRDDDAEARDARTVEREAGIDPEHRHWVADARRRAAADRAAAREDREQAEADRRHAGDDRVWSADARRVAGLDELTGARRRGPGLHEVQREISRTERTGGRLVAAYVDVDNLKSVNDRLGHADGDALLVTVTAVLRDHMRDYDLLIRLGGDEFLCLLGDLTLDQARLRFERVDRALAEVADGASITAGFSVLREGDTPSELITRADQDLLASRRQRRGAVNRRG